MWVWPEPESLSLSVCVSHLSQLKNLFERALLVVHNSLLDSTYLAHLNQAVVGYIGILGNHRKKNKKKEETQKLRLLTSSLLWHNILGILKFDWLPGLQTALLLPWVRLQRSSRGSRRHWRVRSLSRSDCRWCEWFPLVRPPLPPPRHSCVWCTITQYLNQL